MNDSLRRRLIEPVGSSTIQCGGFMLTSGKKPSYYVDMRHTTFHHETSPLIGHVVFGMLEEVGFGAGVADAVGELAMGVDPVVTAIMHAVTSCGLDVDAFVVRREAKDHGTKRRVEGPSIEGRNVVILEDTSTIDGSPIQALKATCEAGTNALAVAVIVGRATGARGKIEACDVPYLAMLGLEDLGLGAQA